MSLDFQYNDNLPPIAGGFLKPLTFDDIKAIIGGLGEDIEEADKDLDEGYDTDKLETSHKKEKEKEKEKEEKSLIIDNNNDSDSETEELIVEKPKRGGGNVLQILVSLIPTVFPKSYM